MSRPAGVRRPARLPIKGTIASRQRSLNPSVVVAGLVGIGLSVANLAYLLWVHGLEFVGVPDRLPDFRHPGDFVGLLGDVLLFIALVHVGSVLRNRGTIAGASALWLTASVMFYCVPSFDMDSWLSHVVLGYLKIPACLLFYNALREHTRWAKGALVVHPGWVGLAILFSPYLAGTLELVSHVLLAVVLTRVITKLAPTEPTSGEAWKNRQAGKGPVQKRSRRQRYQAEIQAARVQAPENPDAARERVTKVLEAARAREMADLVAQAEEALQRVEVVAREREAHREDLGVARAAMEQALAAGDEPRAVTEGEKTIECARRLGDGAQVSEIQRRLAPLRERVERENRARETEKRKRLLARAVNMYDEVPLARLAKLLQIDDPIELEKWLLELSDALPLTIAGESLKFDAAARVDLTATLDQLMASFQVWEREKFGKRDE